MPYPAKYIRILADSQVAQKALANNSIKSETVQRTICKLSQLGHDIPRLTLTWIKAHVGYEGNEVTDLSAKQGAQEPDISIKIDVLISTTEITNKLKELINNKLMLRWTTIKEYKHSKKFLEKHNWILLRYCNCED